MARIAAIDVDAIRDGEAAKVEANGLDIAIFKVNGEFFALNDHCSHGNASMSEGYVEDDFTVECPLHSARFCLKSGEALCQPATDPIAAYPIVIEGGKVYVELPEAA